MAISPENLERRRKVLIFSFLMRSHAYPVKISRITFFYVIHVGQEEGKGKRGEDA